MTKKYFGTDGIRGRVGQGCITPAFMLHLGWAVGKVLASEDAHPKVVIGKDTRISGYMFESALEAGLSAAGVDILLLGPMPTPAIAYLTRTFRASAGIAISASHNPFYDNGVKFFNADGKKLSDELEKQIEALLEQPMDVVASAELGKALRVKDAAGRYIEFCKGTFPHQLNLDGLKIVVDSANGAAYHIAKDVFHELGAEVEAIGNDPDGLNINLDCGATAMESLASMVKRHGADVGIALDGDADRCIMVDHEGDIVDGDEILAIIVAQEINDGWKVDGVVGTLMSNLGLEQALQQMGVELIRAKVGDRYVMEALIEKGWSLGGESSGHTVNLDLTTTGDGIITALRVLRAMQLSQKNLRELKQVMIKHPQVLINVPTKQTVKLENYPELQSFIQQKAKGLEGIGRLLVRPSGTETLVRVMVEANDACVAERVASEVAEVVEGEVG